MTQTKFPSPYIPIEPLANPAADAPIINNGEKIQKRLVSLCPALKNNAAISASVAAASASDVKLPSAHIIFQALNVVDAAFDTADTSGFFQQEVAQDWLIVAYSNALNNEERGRKQQAEIIQVTNEIFAATIGWNPDLERPTPPICATRRSQLAHAQLQEPDGEKLPMHIYIRIFGVINQTQLITDPAGDPLNKVQINMQDNPNNPAHTHGKPADTSGG